MDLMHFFISVAHKNPIKKSVHWPRSPKCSASQSRPRSKAINSRTRDKKKLRNLNHASEQHQKSRSKRRWIPSVLAAHASRPCRETTAPRTLGSCTQAQELPGGRAHTQQLAAPPSQRGAGAARRPAKSTAAEPSLRLCAAAVARIAATKHGARSVLHHTPPSRSSIYQRPGRGCSPAAAPSTTLEIGHRPPIGGMLGGKSRRAPAVARWGTERLPATVRHNKWMN
jgi:hypothetical protein